MSLEKFKLSDPSLLVGKSLVGSDWIEADSGKSFDIFYPASGALVASVADCGAQETERAILCAQEAQKDWAKVPAKQRSAVLRRWYELILENSEDLAKIISAEMGKPITESVGEVLYGASFLEWFAEEAKRIDGDVLAAPAVDRRMLVLRQPVGVVGAITPWNFPCAMVTRKVGPALAAGCSVVLKPAEQTPLSATSLAVLALRAGVPAGVLNIITSDQPEAIGNCLTQSPIVRKITFTGSTEVGRILMRGSSEHIKKISLELGGNAPLLVFDSANVKEAAAGALISKYRNAGQTCVCANRLFVQAGIYDEFVAEFSEQVAKLSMGEPFDRATEIGPLVNKDALDKVQAHFDDAIEHGAKLVVGGNAQPGLYFEPTIVTNASREMLVYREETFGPLAPIFRFETEEEAVTAANDTPFGLAAYFFSKDLAQIWRVSEELEFGIVSVNSGNFSSETAPFGGMKQSGIGREGSRYGIDEFQEMKYVSLSIN